MNIYLFIKVLSIIIAFYIIVLIFYRLFSGILSMINLPTILGSFLLVCFILFLIKIQSIKQPQNQDSKCIPTVDCSKLKCGDTDSCGSICNTESCDPPNTCIQGKCECIPTVDCSKLKCGDTDSCGSICNTQSCDVLKTCIKGKCECIQKDCSEPCNITLFNFNKYPEYTGYWILEGISSEIYIKTNESLLSLYFNDSDNKEYKIIDIDISNPNNILYNYYTENKITYSSTFIFNSKTNKYIDIKNEYYTLYPLVCN
jgi:hypothetical protein